MVSDPIYIYKMETIAPSVVKFVEKVDPVLTTTQVITKIYDDLKK